ncbi:MAG TPA: hypothetical protein VNX18_10685 [Bryobacteraceae bacterium]|nr:hypothetical protein [Bryobacteraceae bacterium]
MAGLRWFLPINGTRSSKAIIARLMTRKPEALFTFTGTWLRKNLRRVAVEDFVARVLSQ